MIKKIVFFNFWRNGDSFLPKEYVRDIISRFPEVEFEYAHKNHRSIIADLNCKWIYLEDLPRQLHTNIPFAHDEASSVLYINTWVGCWIGKHFQEKEHANFVIVHNIWKEVYKLLNIEMKGNYDFYLPRIYWHRFNLKEVREFLEFNRKPIILVCNGVQQSEQSSMGDMKNIVEHLAKKHTDHLFLLAHDVAIDLPNVRFTSKIFNSEFGNLNQISYISRYSKLIIGKNSGPFTYAHTIENINDPEKTFLCFSHKLKDCLLGEGTYLCNSYFSDTIEDQTAIRICDELISNPIYSTERKVTSHIL